MSLLGLDIGTTGVKGLLVSETGTVVAEASQSYAVFSPQPSWYEQNPEDWWEASIRTIRMLLSGNPSETRRITGIGLSGQYHGLVILDEDQKVIRPCILWNDQRTQAESDFIVDTLGKRNLIDICATGGAPYFTACKLLWVRNHEPRNYARVKKILLPKDYVRFKLTGECVTDVTDASGTLFLDVKNRCWSRKIPDMLGVDSDILPGLVESSYISGRVSKRAAEATGLPVGTPVAGGGGDQACAAVGMGITEEGSISYSIGTSGVVYGATDNPVVDEQGRFDSFCHAVPGKWCVLACINAAAASFEWFKRNFSDREELESQRRGVSVYRLLDEEAGKVPPGSDKLLFLPYLSGERHPHTDTHARGVFFGLHTGHTKAHMVRSILEGVAFAFRDCLEGIKDHDVEIKEIRATGGGAKSPLWMDIQASVSGERIALMNADSGGAAFGAAVLGGVCAGDFQNVREACSHLIKPGEYISPNRVSSEIYDGEYRVFQSLYPLLKHAFYDLSAL